MGSETKVHSTYICKEAKDLLRKGYSVEKIREILNVQMDNLQEVHQDVIDGVLNAKKRYFKRISNFTSGNPIINSKTDPDVKKFIQSLIDDE